MGYDGKYGRVTTERGTIGEDEPVIVFRAQDVHVPAMLDFYRQTCAAGGAGQEHIEAIDHARRECARWQDAHRDQVKLPDTRSGEVF